MMQKLESRMCINWTCGRGVCELPTPLSFNVGNLQHPLLCKLQQMDEQKFFDFLIALVPHHCGNITTSAFCSQILKRLHREDFKVVGAKLMVITEDQALEIVPAKYSKVNVCAFVSTLLCAPLETCYVAYICRNRELVEKSHVSSTGPVFITKTLLHQSSCLFFYMTLLSRWYGVISSIVKRENLGYYSTDRVGRSG